jgi:hypothetical protein
LGSIEKLIQEKQMKDQQYTPIHEAIMFDLVWRRFYPFPESIPKRMLYRKKA